MSFRTDAAAFQCLEQVLLTKEPLAHARTFFDRLREQSPWTDDELAEAERHVNNLLAAMARQRLPRHRIGVYHGKVFWVDE